MAIPPTPPRQPQAPQAPAGPTANPWPPAAWPPAANGMHPPGHGADGPGNKGAVQGPGKAGGPGGGLGLNVDLNLLGLNIGLGAQLGLGGIGATANVGAMMLRLTNDQNDADAIARLRQQSQGFDLQTGRAVVSQNVQAVQAPMQTAAAAAAAGQGQADVGVAIAKSAASASAGAGGQASGNAFATGSASAPVATGGLPPVTSASLDKVVSALDNQTNAQARVGPTSETSRSVAPAQAGVAVSLPTNGDPLPPPALTQRADAAALGVTTQAPQEAGARPATTVQAQPALGPNSAPGALPIGAPAAPQQTLPAAQQAAGRLASEPAAQVTLPAGPGQPAVTAELLQTKTAQLQQTPAVPPAATIAAPTMSTLQPTRSEAKSLPPSPTASQVPPQISAEAPLASALAPSTGGAPVSDPFGAPVEPVAALGPRAAGEAIVARQIQAVEQAERVSGPAAALRELNGRLREMPAESSAKVLAGLQPMLGRAAESHSGSQRAERIEKVNGILERSAEEVSSRAAMARTGADLASVLDQGSLEGMGAHVTKDVARAIANNEHSTAERVIAFGHAVAFGSGLSLPFALIEAYDEKGDGETARELETALAGGLARLLHRLHEAVDALSTAAGPVAFEWAAWRAKDVSGPELERRLRSRLSAHEGLIKEIDEALDAVDAAGDDMVRALERLSRFSARTPEIIGIWREVTSSRKAAFAIAQSLAAQHVVAQALAAGLRTEPPGEPDGFSREAAQALYERFGFAREGAAELAEISLARHEAIQMSGGWVRARKAQDPSDEAAFARIVAFLKGHCAPSNRHIETVSFADLDPDGERPLTLVGAPLLERFHLMEAA